MSGSGGVSSDRSPLENGQRDLQVGHVRPEVRQPRAVGPDVLTSCPANVGQPGSSGGRGSVVWAGSLSSSVSVSTYLPVFPASSPAASGCFSRNALQFDLRLVALAAEQLDQDAAGPGPRPGRSSGRGSGAVRIVSADRRQEHPPEVLGRVEVAALERPAGQFQDRLLGRAGREHVGEQPVQPGVVAVRLRLLEALGRLPVHALAVELDPLGRQPGQVPVDDPPGRRVVVPIHRHQLVAGRVEHALELLDGVEELAVPGLLDAVGDPGRGGVVGRAVLRQRRPRWRYDQPRPGEQARTERVTVRSEVFTKISTGEPTRPFLIDSRTRTSTILVISTHPIVRRRASRMTAIAPSILAADFSRLGEQVREVEAGGADRIHVDVMDGHFVPNLSMGPVVVKGLRPVTRLPLEVHLMVEEPGQVRRRVPQGRGRHADRPPGSPAGRPPADPRHPRPGQEGRAGDQPGHAGRGARAVPAGHRPGPVHDRLPRLRRAGVPAGEPRPHRGAAGADRPDQPAVRAGGGRRHRPARRPRSARRPGRTCSWPGRRSSGPKSGPRAATAELKQVLASVAT